MTVLEIIGHPLCSAEFCLVPKVGVQAKYDGTDGAVTMALLMLEARALVEGIFSSSRERRYSHDSKIRLVLKTFQYPSGHRSGKAYNSEGKAHSKYIAALRVANKGAATVSSNQCRLAHGTHVGKSRSHSPGKRLKKDSGKFPPTESRMQGSEASHDTEGFVQGSMSEQ